MPYKVPVAGQQGKKPLPGQNPPGAKPKPKPAGAGNKELSYDSNLDMAPEEFSGYLPSIKSDDHLVWSGDDSLDDGSAPGSVTIAFDDPELIAMQASAVGSGVHPDGGSAGNLALNSDSSTDQPLYQFFLDDGSDGSSGAGTASTSGNLALNTDTSGDKPLYDFFLNSGASTADAGAGSTNPQGDVSLFATNDAGQTTDSSTDGQVGGLTSFPALAQGSTSEPNLFTDGATASEPNLSPDGSNLQTASSNSDTNLFTDGSDSLLSMSDSNTNLFTDPSYDSLAQLPAGGGTGDLTSGSDSSLFTDSLSAGTDMFARRARNIRRQEL